MRTAIRTPWKYSSPGCAASSAPASSKPRAGWATASVHEDANPSRAPVLVERALDGRPALRKLGPVHAADGAAGPPSRRHARAQVPAEPRGHPDRRVLHG